MDRRAPLFLAAALSALPLLARAERAAPAEPEADAAEEGAEVPCAERADKRKPKPAPAAPDGEEPSPDAAPAADPCAREAVLDGRSEAPAARPAPAAAPAPDERRGEERRERQKGAGRNARRQAAAMISSLSGEGSGAAPASGAAPRAAAPGPDPGGVISAADFRRLNDVPAASGPNTLRTAPTPAPPGTAAKAPPAAAPAWRRAWEATKDFVDRHTPSPYKLANDVSFEAEKRFPNTSSHNTEQDAWRHARWHQKMVDSLCPETGRSVCAPVAAGVALAAGTVHELMGAVSGQPAEEFKMDMSNNWKGALAGIKGSDPRHIDQALASGQLVVLSPTAPSGGPMVARR